MEDTNINTKAPIPNTRDHIAGTKIFRFIRTWAAIANINPIVRKIRLSRSISFMESSNLIRLICFLE